VRAIDRTGLALTTLPAAIGHWDELVEQFLSHGRATPSALTALLAADPDCLMGWCAKGLFSLLLARGELVSVAADALSRARLSQRERGASRREQLYIDALAAAVDGRLGDAVATFEQGLDSDPGDSFAAKLSHAFRFMLGDARGMRQSIERVLQQTGIDHPHIGYLLGCRAFALEETGAYEEAEIIGRRALERASRDAWGLHAVSHVHEMTGRAAEGARFLAANESAVAHCNNFSYHVFWHLALFQLEIGERTAALALYDSRIRAEHTDDFRDIANAASLLTRLEIDGVVVGSRWDELADIAERRINDRTLVFADLHYLIALAAAGRVPAAQAFVAGIILRPAASDQGRISREIGLLTATAIEAFFGGKFAECALGLQRVRLQLYQIGGSHAQRDVFEQIMLEAMVRAGMHREVRPLLRERLARRSHNRFASERLVKVERTGRMLGGSPSRLAKAPAAPDRH
jgi:tetratricopeptide (TPR) repeat protein